MSMFFLVTASGPLKYGKLPEGYVHFSEPTHIIKADILQAAKDGEYAQEFLYDLILDKANCKNVQILDQWDDNQVHERGQLLLVKAMGYSQATERAQQYGKEQAVGYYERKKEASERRKRIDKLAQDFKELFGVKKKKWSNH